MFQKASKKQVKAKLALTGPSGSGKTMSALLLAKGLGGRVAVIDTENSSASLYADKFGDFTYDVLSIAPPYTAPKYFKAIETAIAEKYDVLIIDSISHLWAGEGGLLEQKSALDSRGGNSYTNWNSITKIHEHFKSLMQHSPIHLIVTMRSKQGYVLETTDKGKQAPKKVGMAPIQRQGMEYEFTSVFDIGMDHQFMVSKDRTDLFDGVVAKISVATGKTIRDWLNDGVSFADQATVAAAREVLTETAPREPRQARAERAASALNGNPGEHVCAFGKFKGQKLKDCDIGAVADYVAHIENEAEAGGKDIKGQVADFLDAANAFLAANIPTDNIMDVINDGTQETV